MDCIKCHKKGLLKDDSLCPVCLGTGIEQPEGSVEMIPEASAEAPKKTRKPRKTAPKAPKVKESFIGKLKKAVRGKK